MRQNKALIVNLDKKKTREDYNSCPHPPAVAKTTGNSPWKESHNASEDKSGPKENRCQAMLHDPIGIRKTGTVDANCVIAKGEAHVQQDGRQQCQEVKSSLYEAKGTITVNTMSKASSIFTYP